MQASPRITRFVMGRGVLGLNLGGEKDLYPGGGIRATFTFYFLDEMVIYAKSVWWDA